MKICIFTQNMGNYISGGRWYPWYIAHCLSKAKNQVTIFTKTMPAFDKDFVNFCENKPRIMVRNYYGTRDNECLNILKDCDLVIGFPADSLDYAVTFGKQHNKKIAAFVYEPINMIIEFQNNGIEIPFNWQENIWQDFMKQIVKTDMIICSNRTCVRYAIDLFKNYKGKIVSLFNGINTITADLINLKESNERENAIAYISRTVKYKGYGDIALYFSQMDKEVKKPKIYFITGFLDKMDKLQLKFFEDCEKMGLEIEKKVLCNDLEKFEILSRVKALFFPSRFEGFGLPPAEAFYLNTPVICYPLPILKEVYKDYPYYMDLENMEDNVCLLETLFMNENMLFEKVKDAREYVKSFASVDGFTNNLMKTLKGEQNMNIEIQGEKEVRLADVIIMNRNTNIERCLEQQSFTDFNVVDSLRKCKSKYTVIVDGNIDLKPKALENLLLVLETSDAEISYGFYEIDGKKMSVTDYSYDSYITNPNIFGIVAIKTEKLKQQMEEVDKYWTTDLCLREDLKWKNVRKVLFSIPKNHYMLTKEILSIIKEDFYSKQNIYKFDESNILEVRNDYEIKSTLLMILARTPNYLKNLWNGLELNKDVMNKVDIVLGHHIPDGNWNKEVLDFAKDKEWGVVKFTGDFNFCKFNNNLFTSYLESRHKNVIILNDDVILTQNAIKNLLSVFDYKEHVGVVGSKLIHTPNSGDLNAKNLKLQHAGVQILKDRLCTHAYRDYPENYTAANYIREYKAVTFAFVAIDVNCYKEIMLDETIPVEFNDIDFCLRAYKKGWKIYYTPYAKAFHAESSTRKGLKLIGLPNDGRIFSERHKDIFDRSPLYRDMLQLENMGC